MEFKVITKNDDGEYIHESNFLDIEAAMAYMRSYVVLNNVSRPTPLAVDGELPCLTCGGEVGHRINCPHGIAFTPSTATKA